MPEQIYRHSSEIIVMSVCAVWDRELDDGLDAYSTITETVGPFAGSLQLVVARKDIHEGRTRWLYGYGLRVLLGLRASVYVALGLV